MQYHHICEPETLIFQKLSKFHHFPFGAPLLIFLSLMPLDMLLAVDIKN